MVCVVRDGVERAPVQWLYEGTGRSPELLRLVLKAACSQSSVNGRVPCNVSFRGFELLSPSKLPSHLGSETSQLCDSEQGTQSL